jgi:phosphoribosylanthranilate isomerase
MCLLMQRIMIQIYEIQEPREAEAVAALGVDRIGTVIMSGEDWKLPILKDTVRVVQEIGALSGLIPLLSDRETIFRILDHYQPDFIHFCDVLSPFPSDQTAVMQQCDVLVSLQQAVLEQFPAIDIMRSLSIPRLGAAGGEKLMKNTLSIMDRLAPVSDYFLLDTLQGSPGSVQKQPMTGFVGITGEICDWRIAKAVVAACSRPVILAGGLDGENVREAILTVQPAGVDSCTRTNLIAPDGRRIRFKKDLAKVKRMVEEVRRAEAERPDA